MMTPLTLTHPTAGPGGTPQTVVLPEQLAWTDEFAWQPVVQAIEYSTTGALLLDVATKQAGRPITLEGSETRAWCQRGALLTLQAWSWQAGVVLTLSGLRSGPSRQVVFNHSGGAVKAVPVIDYADPTDDQPYAITLMFLEI